MTFHPTWRDRFVPLLILAICAGLVAASAYFFATRSGAVASQFGQALAVTGLLLAGAGYLNWLSWNETVRLLENGLEWSQGTTRILLAWDNVAGFGWKEERKYMRVGVVDKTTKELRLLPFLSPSLYGALKSRCGRLPAEIEKVMGFRDSSTA